MIAAICQMHAGGRAVAEDWRMLVRAAHEAKADIVLLPQMPFSAPFPGRTFDCRRWDEAVVAHDRAEALFSQMDRTSLLGTRPMDFGNDRYEEGFVWNARDGFRGVHAQTRVEPSSEGWYERATQEFVPVPVGEAMVGFLMGEEIADRDELVRYRSENVDLLVALCSASRPSAGFEACRSAALTAGAYCLCSVKADIKGAAGAAWGFGPYGELLAATDAEHPVIAMSLDLSRARAAKAAPWKETRPH